MLPRSAELSFLRYRTSGDPEALARVFDSTAPELARLARHLATAEADAEDLLQATYLTAIEARERYDNAQRILPWLVGILANHAREARRRKRRALDPDRLREPLSPDPADAASRAELDAALESAIARLPEAHRAVLRLHLQHGLEPAEIAKTLERPPGTVRAQLSRGLDRVRRALPPSYAAAGSGACAVIDPARLSALRATLLARAEELAPVGSLALPAAGFAAVLMNKKVVGLGALALLLLLAAVLRERLAIPPSPEVVDARVRRNVEAPLAPAAASRVEARAVAAAPAEAAVALAPVAARTGSLRVRVVTYEKSTTPGEFLQFSLPDIGLVLRRSPERENFDLLTGVARTDETGTASFDALAPGSYSITADVSALSASVDVVAGECTERDVTLFGTDVDGLVLDERGAPIPDAGIWAHGSRLEACLVAHTDSQGKFALREVNGVALEARKRGYVPSKAESPIESAGGRAQLRLVLGGAPATVEGRVVDSRGEPVADALVILVPETGNSRPDPSVARVRPMHVRTASDGSFRSEEIATGVVIVLAVARSLELAPTARRIEVGAAPAYVELRLGSGAVLEGQVTEGGRPAPDCSIAVRRLQMESDLLHPLALRWASTDVDGRYRVTGIMPGEVDVLLNRSGSGGAQHGPLALAEGETERWDFDFAAGARSSVAIEIVPPRAPGIYPAWSIHVSVDGAADKHTSTRRTDETGRATFAGLPDGRCVAFVSCGFTTDGLVAPAYLPLVRREFDAREAHVVVQVPEELLRLYLARGRLTDATGAALVGRALRVRVTGLATPVELRATSLAGGRFDFAGLLAGDYVLEQVDAESTTAIGQFTIQGDGRIELGSFVGK